MKKLFFWSMMATLGFFVILTIIAVAITGYMIVKGTSDQPSTFDKSGFGVTVYSDAKPCSDIPNSLEEGGYIRDYIIQSADFFELPSGYLAAVMEQESQFKPTATSPVGARGLMQLMPDTYKQLNAQELSDTSAELAKARGFTKGNDVYRNIYTKKIEREGSVPITYLGAPNDADIVNVKYNTFLGAAYYRQHFDDFKHATKYHKAFTDKQLQEVMLAAYNAGPGAVDKYNGVPPIKETKEYVKNIMARFKIYEGCMKQEKAGASSNAAKILEKYVADNPKIACQFNNPVGGPNGCARTARDVLSKAFPGSNTAGGAWTLTTSVAGSAPNTSDLAQAQRTLSDGKQDKLPVWHIVGHGSGQHWIVVTGIQGNNVRFYDPEFGNIQTKPFLASAGANLPGQYYFGITAKGRGEGGGANERGYTFTKP